MADSFYGAIGISGGSDGFLDNIDGTNLADGHGVLLIATASNIGGLYELDADSAAVQVVPTIIQPDTNAGDKRWILRALQMTGLDLYEPGTTNLFQFSQSAGDVIMDNTYDGGTITLRGENSGNSTMLVADPAGALSAYYAGVISLTTTADGLGIHDTSGSNPVLYFRDDAAVNLSRIWNSATAMQLDLYNGSSYENAVKANLNGAVELYYDNLLAMKTTAFGVEVRDTSGTSANIGFRDSSGNTMGNVNVQATSMSHQLGAAAENAIKANLNGSVELYYDNIKEAETASGALKATNSLTIASTTNVTGILDEDDLTSDSATALATQQSIKAYVDGLNADENVLTNGDFLISQRGDPGAAADSGEYIADRFMYFKTGSMVHTVDRDTDVPTVAESSHQSNYSAKVDCTTADIPGASDFSLLQYQMEGTDMSSLIGETVTLSFWVKATLTGTQCVAFKNILDNKGYVSEFTINTTDTWEKKTVTLELPSTQTWTTSTSASFRVYFTLCAGSTYQAANETWTTGTFFGTSSTVNNTSSTSNDYQIAQVKLEIGTIATPFRSRTLSEEILRCQRYYEHSYGVDVAPGTVTEPGAANQYATQNLGNGYPWVTGITFAAEKRGTPTITIVSSSDGATGYARNVSTATNKLAVGGNASKRTFSILGGETGFAVDGNLIKAHWIAESEL